MVLNMNTNRLGEERIGKLLLQFSVPAIIGMVVNALYVIIDRIFVGHGVGLLGISATTVAFPISLVIMAFGMLIGFGSAASISIRLGEKNKDEAEHILGNAFALIVISSAFLTCIGLTFEDPILKLFGASAEVLPLAKDFVTILLLGVVMQNIGFGLTSVIRAEGNPKMAMITMLISALLNIGLNPLFIFVFHMGIKGSALATVVSTSVASIWILIYFTGKKSLLKLHVKNLRLNIKIVTQIFSIGASMFLMQVTASIITILFNNSLKKYSGDVAIAAFGIINSITLLILMPVYGINQGAQPIIGYNYGAKNFHRVKQTLKLAIVNATIITTVGFVIVELFARQILSIFGSNNEELLNIGAYGMRIFLLTLPILGVQSTGYFQAVGKSTIAIILSLSRQVIFLLPAIFILPIYFQLTGVWVAEVVADILATALVVGFLIREIKQLNEKQRLMDDQA